MPGFWEQPARVSELLRQGAETGSEAAALAITAYHGRRIRLELQGQKGYLVLADKLAHFPGWQARSADGPRPVLHANAVATALPLNGSEQWIELEYWPGSLSLGGALALLSLLPTLLAAWRGDRWLSRLGR
jgi:hypothetical protein